MNIKKDAASIILITVIVMLKALDCKASYAYGADVSDFLMSQFCHANSMHLLANALAIWGFRPRWSTLIIGYVVAVIACAIDSQLYGVETCGASAWIFAMTARNNVAWSKDVREMMICMLLCILLPFANWHVHIMSFSIAWFVWHYLYRWKKRSEMLTKLMTV